MRRDSRPNRHVARVRQKRSGFHNRRFKGKNPSEDRKKFYREYKNHKMKVLDEDFLDYVRTLRRSASLRAQRVLDTAVGLLVSSESQISPLLTLTEIDYFNTTTNREIECSASMAWIKNGLIVLWVLVSLDDPNLDTSVEQNLTTEKMSINIMHADAYGDLIGPWEYDVITAASFISAHLKSEFS